MTMTWADSTKWLVVILPAILLFIPILCSQSLAEEEVPGLNANKGRIIVWGKVKDASDKAITVLVGGESVTVEIADEDVTVETRRGHKLTLEEVIEGAEVIIRRKGGGITITVLPWTEDDTLPGTEDDK